MSPGDFLIAIVLLAAVAVQLAGNVTRKRSRDRLVSLAARALEQLETLPERIGNTPATSSAELSELRSQLQTLARDLNDVDERAEARFRRLTARARRADAEDEPEPEVRSPFPIGRPPQAEPQAANGRRRLIRNTGR